MFPIFDATKARSIEGKACTDRKITEEKSSGREYAIRACRDVCVSSPCDIRGLTDTLIITSHQNHLPIYLQANGAKAHEDQIGQ